MQFFYKLKRGQQIVICCALFLVIVLMLGIVTGYGGSVIGTAPTPSTEAPTEPPAQAPTEEPNTHIIKDFNVIPQDVLLAGCETYACTMLLQHMGFDMDEYMFAEQYLITQYMYYDEYGTRYGPDMNSAQAGDVYTGYGIYAPAMAKSMNNYLTDVGSDKRAYPLEGVSLAELCTEYIDKDIPVMVWATTWMMEPYDKDSWIVDYVDENAKYAIGDTFTWQQNEHCLVLIGYDDKEFFFGDSCERDVSHFDKALCQERYEQIGTMAIVVK